MRLSVSPALTSDGLTGPGSGQRLSSPGVSGEVLTAQLEIMGGLLNDVVGKPRPGVSNQNCVD